jgi:hypothetical protein
MNRFKKLQIAHNSRKLALAALVLLYAVGCNSSDSAAPSSEGEAEDASPYSVHVAFSGGGWRAHTGHAGWTLSLLEGGSKTLEDVFAHVGTVSSNSGGSWFSTMLMYSGDFVTAIEAKNAINTWPDTGEGATGWLGQQQYLFDQAYCHSLSGDKFTACVFAYYTGEDATYWHKVVEDLVFMDYPITEALSGKRQTWAEDKPLLLAATILTTEAVLGEEDGDKQYYQACLSPSTPVLNGDGGASCSGETGAAPDVTPVTFSSIPSGSTFMAPPFLPAAGAGTNGPHFNLGYTENASSSPATATTTIENPLANDLVPVVTAAAASSAAAGFAASGVVSGDWEEAYQASDLALNFRLAGNMQNVVANGMTVEALAAAKIVQIADGGPVDNSGVAQLVSFLQLNNEADGFNIVAFDNVQEIYTPGGSAANVGIDIAYLFGEGLWQGNQFCSGTNGSGTCITVPKLQIFEVDPLTSPPELTWSAAASDNSPPNLVHELIYTKYTVTTTDNPTLGVAAGTTGTLHAFTCAWSDADTSPQNNTQDGDFKTYADMLNFINAGLQNPDAQGQTGLKYLQDALGLNQ